MDINVDFGYSMIGVRFWTTADLSIGGQMLTVIDFQNLSNSAVWAAVDRDHEHKSIGPRGAVSLNGDADPLPEIPRLTAMISRKVEAQKC